MTTTTPKTVTYFVNIPIRAYAYTTVEAVEGLSNDDILQLIREDKGVGNWDGDTTRVYDNLHDESLTGDDINVEEDID